MPRVTTKRMNRRPPPLRVGMTAGRLGRLGRVAAPAGAHVTGCVAEVLGAGRRCCCVGGHCCCATRCCCGARCCGAGCLGAGGGAIAGGLAYAAVLVPQVLAGARSGARAPSRRSASDRSAAGTVSPASMSRRRTAPSRQTTECSAGLVARATPMGWTRCHRALSVTRPATPSTPLWQRAIYLRHQRGRQCPILGLASGIRIE